MFMQIKDIHFGLVKSYEYDNCRYKYSREPWVLKWVRLSPPGLGNPPMVKVTLGWVRLEPNLGMVDVDHPRIKLQSITNLLKCKEFVT